jgi:hypothetical protein
MAIRTSKRADPVNPDQAGRLMPVDPLGTNAPQHEVVRRRAYEIYEKRGREHGRELQHWLDAESEVESGKW